MCVGQVVGRYQIVNLLPKCKQFPLDTMWVCRDLITNELIDIRESVLVNNHQNSREYNRVSLVGQRFGKLKVERRAILGYSYVFWRCKCTCGSGEIRYKKTSDLVKGLGNLSCGCERQKHKYELNDLPLYNVFKSMKQRCYNANNKDFDRYGKRGIYICKEWLFDPKLFIVWAHNSGYTRGLEIDRINNDDPYAPWNCRWVDRATQNRNTSANIPITVDGVTKLCSEWARVLNLSKCRISDQLRATSMNECIHYIREKLKESNSTFHL